MDQPSVWTLFWFRDGAGFMTPFDDLPRIWLDLRHDLSPDQV
jgi:hypothetical protein